MSAVCRGGMGCIVFVMLFLTGCEQPAVERPVRTASEGPVIEQETWSFDFVLSTDGLVQARVHAGHMIKWQSEEDLRLNEGVTVRFYHPTGAVSSTVVSDSAVVEGGGEAFSAFRSVEAVSDSGVILHSSHLRWEKARDEIFTDSLVTMITGTDTLTGRGFRADPDLRGWQLRQAQGSSKSGFRLK